MSNYKKYFKKAIKSHYPDRFTQILTDVDREYIDIAVDTRFAARSKNPIDKRLDFCAYFLALIKVLDKASETFDTIRAISLEITIDYVRPKNKIQAFGKRLLPKLVNTQLVKFGFKLMHKRVSKNDHPQGFIAHIITDKQQTYGFGYGFDILECGICKLFKKHNSFKYASILCEVDKVTSGMVGLELIRTDTIANGAKTCDFRFKKV